jgi:hypothetical protein
MFFGLTHTELLAILATVLVVFVLFRIVRKK